MLIDEHVTGCPSFPVSTSDPPVIGDVCCLNHQGLLVPLHTPSHSLATKLLRSIGRLLHFKPLQYLNDPPPIAGIYLGSGQVMPLGPPTTPAITVLVD